MKLAKFISFLMMFGVTYVHAGGNGGDDDDDDDGSSGKGGKGYYRKLSGVVDMLSNDRVWESYKSTCGNVDYDIKFMIRKDTGHLEGFASPVNPAMVPDTCIPIMGDVIFQSHTGRNYKRVQGITGDKADFFAQRESYDMGVRKFSDLAAAVEAVDVDSSSTYMSKLVPKNCGTFLLELGKTLSLPIDSNLMTFVVSNMKTTTFMDDFSSSTAFKTLSVESWFGNTRRLGANSGDNDSMIRRLFEYMLEQQYPKELVKLD